MCGGGGGRVAIARYFDQGRPPTLRDDKHVTISHGSIRSATIIFL